MKRYTWAWNSDIGEPNSLIAAISLVYKRTSVAHTVKFRGGKRTLQTKRCLLCEHILPLFLSIWGDTGPYYIDLFTFVFSEEFTSMCDFGYVTDEQGNRVQAKTKDCGSKDCKYSDRYRPKNHSSAGISKPRRWEYWNECAWSAGIVSNLISSLLWFRILFGMLMNTKTTLWISITWDDDQQPRFAQELYCLEAPQLER